MKEKVKEATNKVHLNGYINKVQKFQDPKNAKISNYIIDMVTMEAYENKETKEFKREYTRHSVSVSSSDSKFIKALDAIKADCEKNLANMGDKEFKPKVNTASLDGVLVTRENTKDGIKFYNQMIVVSSISDIAFNQAKGKKESHNSGMFEGNIAKIDMHDGFANINVATHYYAPGNDPESKNEWLRNKDYHEETTFVSTRVSENFRPEIYNAIKKGEIAVGDLIKVRGQLHEDNWKDEKNNVTRYKTVVDLRSMELIAKKGQKKEQEEEVKKETKEEKKVTKKPAVKKATSKKTQVKM